MERGKISRKKDGNEGAKKRKTKEQGDKEKGRSGERGREREEERNTERKEVKSVNEKYRTENPSSNWSLKLLLKGRLLCCT